MTKAKLPLLQLQERKDGKGGRLGGADRQHANGAATGDPALSMEYCQLIIMHGWTRTLSRLTAGCIAC